MVKHYEDPGLAFWSQLQHLAVNNVHIGHHDNYHDVTPSSIGKRVEIEEDAFHFEVGDKGYIKYGNHYVLGAGELVRYEGYYIERESDGAMINIQQVYWKYINCA